MLKEFKSNRDILVPSNLTVSGSKLKELVFIGIDSAPQNHDSSHIATNKKENIKNL